LRIKEQETILNLHERDDDDDDDDDDYDINDVLLFKCPFPGSKGYFIYVMLQQTRQIL